MRALGTKAATMDRPAVTAAPSEDLVEVIDCEQGTDEWRMFRLGLCTASCFGDIMAGGEGKVRTKILYQLAGELLTGVPAETYSNSYMQRGNAMEAEAREHYAFTRGVEVKQVGFVHRTIHDPLAGSWIVGCSPDGFIGSDGQLQIKTMAPHLLIALSESGRFPTEHRHQIQGEMWVTGRKWSDLMIFYHGMPISPTWRIERDESQIAEIKRAVEVFEYDLRTLVKRIKAKGGER